MSRIRWVFAGAAFLIAGVIAFLYLFSRSSDAYRVALPALYSSPEVELFFGEPATEALLVGVRQQLSHISCAEITFLTRSEHSLRFVEVRLVQRPGARWVAYEVTPGWFSTGKRSCRESH